MTKMRMKSPVFSILKINFDYQELLKKKKKSMHVHTQKSGKGLDRWNTAKLMNFC